MNTFNEAANKIQRCCRSLLAGSYGSVNDDLRFLLLEIEESTHPLRALINLIDENNLTAVPKGFIHEVHNPMNVVMGYCEIILDTAKCNAVQRLYVEIMYQTGKALVFQLDMTFRPHMLHSA